MKFPTFRQFRKITGNINDIFTYLEVDLQYVMKELATGLRRLSFNDNFEGWVQQVSIPAGTEIALQNRLEAKIPNYKLILRGKAGAESVVDGDTEWNLEKVYLKNVGGSTVTVTVAFLV